MRQFRHWQWHLDEMFVKINGETQYLWRAVDHEGEVPGSLRQQTAGPQGGLKFLRKALKRHGRPEIVVRDRLRSYGAALKTIGAEPRQRTGRWLNNCVENAHQPLRRRERAIKRFRRMSCLQKFAATHAASQNHLIRNATSSVELTSSEIVPLLLLIGINSALPERKSESIAAAQ
jgi:putative transposase